MTHQEVKEERKSSDGSPEIKNKIRQIQYQQSNRKIEERVPTADVIVTNPTHYAVAIKYSEEAAKAPYVVAKGVDEMALRIREVARMNNKEIIDPRISTGYLLFDSGRPRSAQRLIQCGCLCTDLCIAIKSIQARARTSTRRIA